MNFRIWNKSERKYCAPDSYFINSSGEILFVDFFGSIQQENKEEYILQKNTGLFDLYGTPIYEGDIVKLYYHHANIVANEFEIKYIAGKWTLDEEKILSEYWFDNKKFGDSCRVVVIGNNNEQSIL